MNLVVATKNRIDEMRLNMKDILVLDIIHFHKQTREVIYNDLLKATLKVSKLQSTEAKIKKLAKAGEGGE